jgi:hypothetical protein
MIYCSNQSGRAGGCLMESHKGEGAKMDNDYSDLLADAVILIVSNQQGPLLSVIEFLESTGPDDEALRTLDTLRPLIFKQAVSLQQQECHEDAARYYDIIIRKYPGSEEAADTKHRLPECGYPPPEPK